MIQELEVYAPISFSNISNYFLTIKNGVIVEINRFTGKQQNSYLYSSSEKTFSDKFIFSPNDDFFALAEKENYIAIYKKGKRKALKRYSVKNLKFRPNKNGFYLMKSYSNSLTIFPYSLPRFKKGEKLFFAKILRDLYDGAKVSIVASQAKFDKLGYNVITPFFVDNEKRLLIYNLEKDSIVGNFAYNKFSFNVNTGVIKVDNEYHLLEIDHIINLGGVKLSDDILVSKNLTKKIFRKGNKTIIKNESNDYTINNSFPLIVTKENLLLIYQNRKGVGSFELNKPFNELKPEWFCSDINKFNEDVLAELDSLISIFNSNTNSIDFSSVEGEIKLKLNGARDFEGKLSVEFKLVDAHGNFINGAAKPDNQNIWCKIIIKGPDGKPLEPRYLRFKEVIAPTETNAFSLVIDQSGSMGIERNELLLKGVENFIAKKAPKDLVNIIKYDHTVVSLNNFDNNNEVLFNLIEKKKYGYEKFQGGTSLLDALNRGISNLKDIKVKGEKYIILFTDGKENTSFLPFDKVMYHAMLNDIKIYTLGYGKNIDPVLLESISNSTGGEFYNILSSVELDWSFSEIYKQTQNKYVLEFPTDKPGKYEVFMELCPPDGKGDTLVLSYLKKEIKIDPVTQTIDLPSTLVIDNSDVDPSYLTDTTNLTTKVKFEAPTEEKITIEDQISIEEEFERITLPYFNFDSDKDVILNPKVKELEPVIEFLNRYPNVKLQIDGHTDNDGTPKYNIDLSLRRAKAVKQLIHSYHINKDRMFIKGYGDTQPLVPNTDSASKAKNRRVEFSLIFD